MQTRPVWHLVPRYNCLIARIDNMLRNRMFPGIDVAPVLHVLSVQKKLGL
jgi:hypothetical protein